MPRKLPLFKGDDFTKSDFAAAVSESPARWREAGA